MAGASPAFTRIWAPRRNRELESNPMQTCPLRTSVIGSYPFPGWLELASQQLALVRTTCRTQMTRWSAPFTTD
jgi:hypothetical protein